MKVRGYAWLVFCAIYATAWSRWLPTLLCAEPNVKVTIEGSTEIVKKQDGKYYLLIKIINKSDTHISLFKGALPWTAKTGTLLLVETRTRKPIKQLHSINDLGPETIEVRANGRIQGELCLSDEFALSDSPASEAVDVFWAFDVKTVDGLHSNRVGGWLPLSRTPGK